MMWGWCWWCNREKEWDNDDRIGKYMWIGKVNGIGCNVNVREKFVGMVDKLNKIEKMFGWGVNRIVEIDGIGCDVNSMNKIGGVGCNIDKVDG